MKQNIELIEKFLDGELSTEEQYLLKNLIKLDKEVSKEYHLRFNVNKAIKEKELMELRLTLETIHKELNVTKLDITRQLITKNWYLVAASITIFILIGSFLFSNLNNSSIDSIYERYYAPETEIFITRSSDDSSDIEIEKALLMFQSGNHEIAIELLSDFKKSHIAQYYLGLSFMETQQFNEAKLSFQLIIDQEDNLFTEQAKWYTALCLLKLEDQKAATILFTSILQDDSFYAKDANDILNKLN